MLLLLLCLLLQLLHGNAVVDDVARLVKVFVFVLALADDDGLVVRCCC